MTIDGFMEYMREANSKKGKPYSERTINGYVRRLTAFGEQGKTHSPVITKILRNKGKIGQEETIFDIGDGEKFDDAIRTLFDNDDFKKLYASPSEGTSAALDVLCRYINDKKVFGEYKTKALDDCRQNLSGKNPKAETQLPETQDSNFSRNRIVFGAPGTGKSHYIEEERKALLKNGGEYERVTFYPDYSYANFVGTYKPVPKVKDGKETITYEYVPGPFMRILVKALKNKRGDAADAKPYLLIVEEINRANAAGVFGDVFQLLDRGGDGESEYPIQTSHDMRAYIAEEMDGNLDNMDKNYSTIKIPNNMFIWATMNSADQGVYPMDTAFKRRWDFEYIGINGKEKDIDKKTRDLLNATVKLGRDGKQQVCWNDLRMAINKKLTELNINEDKQLGPFFIDSKILAAVKDSEGESEDFIRVFKDKVLMYLYEDAARQKRSGMFNNGDKGYSRICKDFDDNGYKALNIDKIESKNGGSKDSKDSSDGEGSKPPEQDANEENETDAEEGD